MENTEVTIIILSLCIIIAGLALYLSFGKKSDTHDAHH